MESGSSFAASTPLPDLDEYVRSSEAWFRSNLQALVEHPTVSPGAVNDTEIRAGLATASEILRSSGADVEIVESKGTPSLMARIRHAQPRARVLVYNHLDVQPAERAGWRQADPFRFEVEPHPERGFLYRGRGTTDDKGPALCAVRAASWATSRGLPIEVAFLWETEEEIGSPNFLDVVRARKDALGCDCVIVSDTIWPTADQPAISAGLRGSLQALLRLRTAEQEVHSGLAGGVARNPVRELCVLATAIDAAGFWHEGVVPPDAEEIASFMRSGFDPHYFLHAHHLERVTTEVPLEMMLRLWTRPTFEIHGLTGGYQGRGTKTIVPHEAELKISFRLVPDQDPRAIGEALLAFVARFNPDVTVTIGGSFAPYRSDPRGRVHDAIHDALQSATGRAPVTIREGGSIGAVPVLAAELGVGVHFLPLSLPDHGYHAPNEYFDWRQARIGMTAFARTFAALAS